MNSQSINNIILKVLYLTIILSIVFKNTEKIVPEIPNILPSMNNVTETVAPLLSNVSVKNPIRVYSNMIKTLNKYLIILVLAFIISSIVFFLTYKIIKFVKNINNTNCFENINENNLIHNINLKIKKKHKLDNKEKEENYENENIIEKENQSKDVVLKIEEIIDNFTKKKEENEMDSQN
jgi:hypothetical protein